MTVNEGDLLWTPPASLIASAKITAFLAWLKAEHSLVFDGYDALWRWSVTDLPGFWGAIWDYFGVISDAPFDRVLDDEGVFGSRWFPGARVNYAEHILRHEIAAEPGETAFCHSAETRPLAMMSWQELGSQVRALATGLRERGVVPGDRVVAYMPNIVETAVAMLATVAIGAVWSSAAPEFGARTVIERFGQIGPKVAFVADGYSFGGRIFDRKDEIAAIVEGLPTLETVIRLPFLGLAHPAPSGVAVIDYAALLDRPPIERTAFRFERVAPDHPLWVLFSSGTTGLPKAIVHGHAGMLAEHLKVMAFHCNLGPGQRMFFYSTTGWMMWNTVIAALITGASAVLYDGSPSHGGIDMLWRMAEQSRTTLFGASPTLVQTMDKAGLRPIDLFDLDALEAVLVGGSPATPETFAWFYDNVKRDLWLTSKSGGTEFCSGLANGIPTLPVRAGEIQVRGLGIDLQVWDDIGRPLVGKAGEMVVCRPAPSMPIRLWGDDDGSRYREAYFSTFPGIWRHGDLARITDAGGVYVYGRSDATLNRYGVRIGSAEIYGVLDRMEAIADSLVVCCEMPGGGYYMPLFVRLAKGFMIDDALRSAIAGTLRREASPRHVPDEIHVVPAIPYTLTGKKMEVPIRKLLMGAAPETVASRDAMADPALLDWYAAFAGRPEIAAHRR